MNINVIYTCIVDNTTPLRGQQRERSTPMGNRHAPMPLPAHDQGIII